MRNSGRNGRAWFRSVLTCSCWPQMPNAHGPFGKDSLTPAERESLRGIPLFINVQSARAVREAHRLGGRALSYLSFMDTYVHTEGFENGTARVPWTPRTAQMLLLDKNGSFVNTHMDGTRRMWRYYVCCNTREYVDAALTMVHEQMRRGADGIFVDNSSTRLPCYGHGFPAGYSPEYRSVLTAIPKWTRQRLVDTKTPPEIFVAGERPSFVNYPMIAALTKHRHLYPDKSHDYAYARLLAKVRKVVRSYGPDKIIIINGDATPFADAVMLESFLYSWAWKGCDRTWTQAKLDAIKNRSDVKSGTRFVALSYFGNTGRPVAEDAVHAFAASALLGYLWSDYGTFEGKLGKTLRTLQLGERLTPLKAAGPVEYSFFEQGLVAINGSSRAHTATVPAPAAFKHARLESILDGTAVNRSGETYRLLVPAKAGRVLVAG